ncbi:hypothetical protein [Muricoccus radiodurans]|uniref:hypothetical protein n=1 Tax=Muricoccus radiodurans TaxID=2231721 RepID=UPI003CF2528D
MENDPADPQAIALDLYAAVLDRSPLVDILDRLAGILGARSHLTQMASFEGGAPTGSDVTAVVGISPEAFEAYRAGFIAHDPWLRLAPTLPPGLVNFTRHVPAPDLSRSFFWNEFARHHESPFHCLAVKFPDARGMVGGFATHRGMGAEPFGPREEAFLQAVAPHLQRVLSALSRLPDAPPAGAAEAALDAMGRGAGLVGMDRRMVFANAALRGMASRGDGFVLGRGGLLPLTPAAARTADTAITAALAAAAGRLRLMEGAGRFVIPRVGGNLPYLAEAIPVRHRPGGDGPSFQGALILVSDMAQAPLPAAGLLRDAFDLTAAEGALAAGLAAGRTLSAIAAARGVSVETLRTQLAAVRRKTGCRRQLDLALLAARLGGTEPPRDRRNG